MRIGLIGINHKSSQLSLREELARACQISFSAESQCTEDLNCVLLSTCNRTEIYFSADDLAEAHSAILHILREQVVQSFEHKLYSYFSEDCFVHLARVTSGLDSVIIAESEIQRQVKDAYEKACLYQTLPSCIHFLFQKSLKIGKAIRTDSLLTTSTVSLEKVIFELSQIFLRNLKAARILFIGNSEINRKILHFFKNKEINQLTLCTRGVVSAEELLREYQMQMLPWDQKEKWQDYDVVICGTTQHEYLIYPEQIHSEQQTKNRIIFDLGLPRNADPRLHRHPCLTLLNIEELGNLIEKKQQLHRMEIATAEDHVRQAVERQLEVFDRKTMVIACE